MGKSTSRKTAGSRRSEYAAATRQAILDAARKLFSERGYFATTVDEIAAEARVAPATVYAVSGGKQGLLKTLVELWVTAPEIEGSLRASEAMQDPLAVIRLIADTCCGMRQVYGDIVRVILNTAPHEAKIARVLATATDQYRRALERVARHVAKLGGLRPGLSVNEVADVLWFYFGYSAVETLVRENGWTWGRTADWLTEQAAAALLRGRPGVRKDG